AHRPRPDVRGPVAPRARDRAGRAGGARRVGARVVPEDIRRDRLARARADPTADPLPGRAPVRESRRRGGRAAHRRPGRRDDDLACRRAARRVRRLRTERARPDDRLCVLRPADARRARLGPAALGGGAGRRPGRVHRADHARPHRRGRRRDGRNVASEGRSRAAIRAAGPRAALVVIRVQDRAVRADKSGMESSAARRRPIGMILVETGAITVDDLVNALAEQRRTRRRLGEILIDSGLITWLQLAEAIAEQARDLDPEAVPEPEPELEAEPAVEPEPAPPTPIAALKAEPEPPVTVAEPPPSVVAASGGRP